MTPIILLMMILGLTTVISLAFFAFRVLGRGWSIQILFKDFNRKIWMTISLGAIFSFVYLGVVGLSVYLANEWGTDLFFLIYHHQVEFIYGGLFLFACATLSIYLARMVVKYFYLTRGKDS